MSNHLNRPRILVVTPEITFVPGSSEGRSLFAPTHTGKIAGMLGGLIDDLYNQGVDIHVAQADYRREFTSILQNEQIIADTKVPIDRVHLAEDRVFFYSNPLDLNYKGENIRVSIAFQREVINQIIPRVQPDLIHCHDWMTGLIPAFAREFEIPCLFSVYKFGSLKIPLSYIEDMGIDTAAFWQHLFYGRYPINYQETRDNNPPDFLLSGISASDLVNIVNSKILMNVVQGQNSFTTDALHQLLARKQYAKHLIFNHSVRTQQYIDSYQRILQRPIIQTNRNKNPFCNHSTQNRIKPYVANNTTDLQPNI